MEGNGHTRIHQWSGDIQPPEARAVDPGVVSACLGCGCMETEDVKLNKCARCQGVGYCSKEC